MIVGMTTGEPLTAGALRKILDAFDDNVQVCIGSEPHAEIESLCYAVRKMDLVTDGAAGRRSVIVLETESYRHSYDKFLVDLGYDPTDKLLYDGADS